MARRNDNYVDAYSNSDSLKPKRRSNVVSNEEKYGTRVFGAVEPAKKKRQAKRTVNKIGLTSVNVALTIIIVALLVCLVALLGIYTTLNV